MTSKGARIKSTSSIAQNNIGKKGDTGIQHLRRENISIYYLFIK
jgi:hypothetical protein